MNTWFSDLQAKFILDFVEKQRYIYIVTGLKVTFEVTLLSLFFGMVIGALVAIVRTTHDQTREENRRGFGHVVLGAANSICRLYLTVIRGTPTMVQLLLWFFVFLVNVNNKVIVAVVAFSVNSGAYVAEIFRSGIMSIDAGQMEAGRSLGLSYKDTMIEIIMPQAVKNCLPALVNEMITLLKETSISGYIGLNELTRGGEIIRGVTYDAFLPLIAVALIYLVIVMFFTWCMGILERRLRRSDIR
ncbi:MAG: amino acid ABC transporter permease [Eubacterium sp.]|nr:amino acid ABC transporter permease [Eubacterium sp.]